MMRPTRYEDYKSLTIFVNEKEAEAWDGLVVRIRGGESEHTFMDGDVYAVDRGNFLSWRNTRSGGSRAAPPGWPNFAPLPKPQPFADAREMYRHMGQEGAQITSRLTGRVRDLATPWWAGIGCEGLASYAPRSFHLWRPFCPYYDAPEPTAEELRKEATKACRAEVEAVLVKYGASWNSTSTEGTVVFRTGGPNAACPPMGIAYSISMANCRKPEES